MNNKLLQETRMKRYFIEATRNILRSEGLKGISVRNIAKDAGYSYATLYNYFNDVRDLVFECVKDFQHECEVDISNKVEGKSAGIERLKAISKAYVEYFLEYPGIFELFYIEKMSAYGNSKESARLIYHFLDRICQPDWDFYAQKMKLNSDFIERLKDQLRFTLTGMLLFYLNRSSPDNYAEFIQVLEQQLNYIWE
ncbi:MAG: TetR/AcrR family transcriptional regulator [Prolixibacteraceae bacterium]|nr:TetR/AcrR family transcriptional regulator [Prolixibacteraceae bacterium]